MTYGIGGTSLIRARELEERLGIDELYLKLEGENPTGTHKDRLAIQHVDDAIIREYDTITVGSCGNYGVAMSFVAGKTGLDCKIYLPEKYTSKHVDRMEGYGSEVFKVKGVRGFRGKEQGDGRGEWMVRCKSRKEEHPHIPGGIHRHIEGDPGRAERGP